MLARLSELAALFLKLGTIGFGGPAAHIAMMESEVVQRRGWLAADEFLDMVGATNLIPGPNSTEMAMHVGYRRAGFLGLIVAGVCFIVPATLITLTFAWTYVELGRFPSFELVLAGIKPAVLAIVFSALWRLGKKAFSGWSLVLIGVAVAGASMLGAGEIPALLAGSLIGMFWLKTVTARPTPPSSPLIATTAGTKIAAIAVATTGTKVASLSKLGLFFLKIGAILFGSGYVLFAYVEGELVDGYGWLTRAQLFDAIAVGQITPGPILSTATFIGYLVTDQPGDAYSGLLGASVATLCIFLPSFLFVAMLGPLVPRLRNNAWAAAFLDAVNAASIGLMIAVTLSLCREAMVDWKSWVTLLVACVLVFRWQVNPVWIVIGGAVFGWLLAFV